MDEATLNKLDDFFETLNETNGNKLSWVTVTINGSKLTMLSDSLGCLDLYELANKLDDEEDE